MEHGKFVLSFTPLPDMKLEPPVSNPNTVLSLQLYFKISNHVHHTAISQSINGSQSTIGYVSGQTKEAFVWIDSALFNSPAEVDKILAPELSRIRICRPEDCAFVVKEIIEKVKSMVRSVPRRRKVMVIDVEIFMELVHRVSVSESYDRAVRESRREFEDRNYGMVATAPSALRTMMKMVEVEGGEEECRICLEGMEEGGFGMSMPCDHVFHVDCILKWLQKSHSCPLCRFEMPTITGVAYQHVRLG
ncbi:RING/U-box superfamily protein [Euphorbia peplus]|nr:RING/U-box superfamily protein [Euphorbia peplus]